MLVIFSSTSFAATSLAWTSITIRADNTALCILDSFPRTRATKSPSWGTKGKYPEAIHSILTQCNQTQGMLSLRLCAVLRHLLPLLVRSTDDCSERKYYSGLAESWVLPTPFPCSDEKKELEPPWSPLLINLRYQVWLDSQNWYEGCSFLHCPSLQFFTFGSWGNPGEVIFHLVIMFRWWSYYQSCILLKVYYDKYSNN